MRGRVVHLAHRDVRLLERGHGFACWCGFMLWWALDVIEVIEPVSCIACIAMEVEFKASPTIRVALFDE